MDQSANPLINLTPGNLPSAMIPPSPNAIKSIVQKNLSKIIFAILGTVVLIEVILGIRTLTKTASNAQLKATQIESMTDAKLVLSPDSNTVKVGSNLTVSVNLVTGGHSTDSTDLLLHYDPKFLEITPISISQGKIYPEYPVVEVDSKLGLIAISGITPPKKPGFIGIGTLATLNFKALQEGQTSLTIDFQKGDTKDSNVVLSGSTDDILDQVFNADINISNQGEIASSKSKSPSCSGYTQYCQTSTGKTGRQLCKLGQLKGSSCVFDPKLTVSCDVCRVE